MVAKTKNRVWSGKRLSQFMSEDFEWEKIWKPTNKLHGCMIANMKRHNGMKWKNESIVGIFLNLIQLSVMLCVVVSHRVIKWFELSTYIYDTMQCKHNVRVWWRFIGRVLVAIMRFAIFLLHKFHSNVYCWALFELAFRIFAFELGWFWFQFISFESCYNFFL